MAPSRWLWGSRSESLFSSAWPVELQATSLGVFDEEVGRFSMIANLHVSFHSFPKEWILICMIFETHKIISQCWWHGSTVGEFPIQTTSNKVNLVGHFHSSAASPAQPNFTFHGCILGVFAPCWPCVFSRGKFSENLCRKWSNLMIIFSGSVKNHQLKIVSHHV